MTEQDGFSDPSTSYPEIAGEWREWWREAIVFNWVAHSFLVVFHTAMLATLLMPDYSPSYPAEFHSIGVIAHLYWGWEDYKNV